MSRERGSIFEDDLDVSGFTPKPAADPKALPPEKVRAVAESSRFPSRQARASQPVEPTPAPAKRAPRRYRTGRTMQFNCRTTQACSDGMYAIADEQGWKIGETLEHAYAALKRELEGQGGE